MAEQAPEPDMLTILKSAREDFAAALSELGYDEEEIDADTTIQMINSAIAKMEGRS